MYFLKPETRHLKPSLSIPRVLNGFEGDAFRRLGLSAPVSSQPVAVADAVQVAYIPPGLDDPPDRVEIGTVVDDAQTGVGRRETARLV
jgi:hypothetical protein